MTWKGFGLFAAGAATGFLVAALKHDVDQAEPDATVVSHKVDSIGRSIPLRNDTGRTATDLPEANENLRMEAATGRSIADFGPPAIASIQEIMERHQADSKQRDTQNLLAAGYSIDRVEYLQRRAEELQAKHRQDNTDRQMNGLPPVNLHLELGLLFDPHIGLRYEIGDLEYEKYLAALKRPTAAIVADVLDGSLADSVGIKSGDAVVSYDNVRVFNGGELDGYSLGDDEGNKSVVVNVLRDGQPIHFVVPRGLLGIRHPHTSTRPR